MKNQELTIFIVEDDPIYEKMLKTVFETLSHYGTFENYTFKIESFDSGEECLKELHQNPFVVYLDFYLNGFNEKAINGLQVLEQIKEKLPETTVIILSGKEALVHTVEIMKKGAYDYVLKDDKAFLRAGDLLQKAIAAYEVRKRKKSRNFKLMIATTITLLLLSIYIIYH